MSTAKPFLTRAASTPVTAAFSNFALLEKDGCDPKLVAALKKLGSHANIVHAQFEEVGSVLQFELSPESDSEVDYGNKVFSVPTMIELGNFLKVASSVEGVNAVETYIDPGDKSKPGITVEIYGEPS